MCLVLKVTRAGFYVWLHNPVSAGEKDNQRLLELIRDSYTLSGGVYGYRRVQWRSSRNWRSVQQKPGCQNHEEKQDSGYTWL